LAWTPPHHLATFEYDDPVDHDEERSVGLRERKRRETRMALSLAAIRLCVQRGWEHVTVDDIAAAANVSPRTFRNYFPTKADAVAAGHLERLLRIAEGLRERPDDEPLLTAMTHAVAAQFGWPAPKGEKAADTDRWRERMLFLFTEPAVQAAVLKAAADAQDALAKAIGERTGIRRRNDPYPQLLAAVVIAVVGVVAGRWLIGGASGSMVPHLQKAFDLVAAGFPEPKT
jgi:AcrR family transcriptional regulator